MIGTLLKVDKLKQSNYVKSIFTLSAGTLLAQAVGVLIAPIITRLYTAEQLGIYTLVLTIVSIFSPIINGRYDMSIVTANNEKEANAVTVVAITLGIFLTLVVCIGVLVCVLYKPSMFYNMRHVIWWVFPILAVSGLTNVFTSYNNRHRQYKLISSVSVIRAIAQAVGQIVVGILKLGVGGLLLTQFISSCLGVRKQARYAMNNFKQLLSIKRSDKLYILKKYKNQLVYSTPALLLNSLSYSILNYIINELYGVKEVGYYSLSFRMLGLPIALISANVARAFFEKATSERREKGNFYNSYKQTLKILSIVSLPIFTFLIIFSEKLFEIIFGTGWGRAGLFVAILSPMFAIRFIVTALSLSLVIGDKQKYEASIQSVFLVISLTTYIISKKYNMSIEYFLFILSGLFFANYLFMLLITLKVSKEQVNISQ